MAAPFVNMPCPQCSISIRCGIVLNDQVVHDDLVLDSIVTATVELGPLRDHIRKHHNPWVMALADAVNGLALTFGEVTEPVARAIGMRIVASMPETFGLSSPTRGLGAVYSDDDGVLYVLVDNSLFNTETDEWVTWHAMRDANLRLVHGGYLPMPEQTRD